MTEKLFWSLIALLAWSKTGDDDAVVEPLVAALAKLDVSQMEEFDDLLAAKLHSLDTEAHARNMGKYAYRGPGAPFSVDAFLYARSCVVANGRSTFEQVLVDPTKMLKDLEFESILYVAAKAYRRRTGEEFTHVPAVSYETFANADGWTIAEKM